MRRLVRWTFGLNAVYQTVIGTLALVAPVLLMTLYGGDAVAVSDLYLRALYRGLGAYMVFSGLVSALVAYDPEGSPLLLLAQGALSVLTLACWGVALAAGDVQWAQVSTDVLIQLPLLAAVVLYYPRAKRYVEDRLMILMDGSWKAPARAGTAATGEPGEEARFLDDPGLRAPELVTAADPERVRVPAGGAAGPGARRR